LAQLELSQRQQTILDYIVRDYIESAVPVGSEYVSQHPGVGLSPATIRNVMADLEEMGYIYHPHVSAGRIPTDKGYRYYVDTLRKMQELTPLQQRAIGRRLKKASDPEALLAEASKTLGRISHQLTLVFSPALRSAALDRLELINLSSSKIAVILSLRSGKVRTIIMEVMSEIRREKLDAVSSLLNERLTGLSLEQIKTTFQNRVKDVQNEETGIVRLLIRSADKVFESAWPWPQFYIGGTPDVIHQPEFDNPATFRAFIRLVNDEKVITRVFTKRGLKPGEITVTIGTEHDESKMKDYSTITSVYLAGDARGTLGVIGPRRMRYARVIPLVNYFARVISTMLS